MAQRKAGTFNWDPKSVSTNHSIFTFVFNNFILIILIKIFSPITCIKIVADRNQTDFNKTRETHLGGW